MSVSVGHRSPASVAAGLPWCPSTSSFVASPVTSPASPLGTSWKYTRSVPSPFLHSINPPVSPPQTLKRARSHCALQWLPYPINRCPLASAAVQEIWAIPVQGYPCKVKGAGRQKVHRTFLTNPCWWGAFMHTEVDTAKCGSKTKQRSTESGWGQLQKAARMGRPHPEAPSHLLAI